MTLVDIISNGGLLCDGDWIEKKDQDVRGKVRLIQLADIGDGEFKDKSSKYITLETAERLHCTFLEKGDILIARLPEPLGRACIFPLEGAYITAVDIAILRIKDISINPQYIMYLINSSTFRSQIKQYESGTTRKRISRKNLEKIEFSLPNLEIQNRIVARIEELFSKLDKAVDTLKTTKEQLEVYRQAVLVDAFRVATNSTHLKIGYVCAKIVDCPHSTPKWEKNGKLCLRTTNFKCGYLDLQSPNYVSEETFNDRNRRIIPQPGDVLYSREGSVLGIACTIPSNVYPCLGQRMMLLRSGEKLNNRYLMHYLNSPMVTNHVIATKGGTGSPHINVGDIKEFQIPIPSLEEQSNIVRQIEEQLSSCDNVEKTVDAILTQADAMRQSILKQAFEE